jgi:hypothetical protein
MAKRVTFAFLVLAVVLAVLWAPWLTPQYVEGRVVDAFNAAWQRVKDGCGFNCRGCGVTQLQRVPAGYVVHIEYACGLLPEDSAAYHRTGCVYVSVVGTVHGLPRP